MKYSLVFCFAPQVHADVHQRTLSEQSKLRFPCYAIILPQGRAARTENTDYAAGQLLELVA